MNTKYTPTLPRENNMDYTQYMMGLWIIESTPDGLQITNGKATEIVIGGYDVASHECIKRNRATLGCDAKEIASAARTAIDKAKGE
jgi:hypothetical protein